MDVIGSDDSNGNLIGSLKFLIGFSVRCDGFDGPTIYKRYA